MIPINLTGYSSVLSQDIPSLIQSDENLVGTASPVEIAAFVIAIVVAYLLGLLASYYLKRKFSHRMKKDHLDFWIRAIQIVLILAAVAITVPPFFDAGLIIVIWVLIGFIAVFAVAGQKVIANNIAALAIMYERPFSSGDFISVGETSGTVVSLGLFAISVRTTRGVLVHIPNDLVYTTTTSNYYSNTARRFEYDVGIRYRDDISRAITVIHRVIDGYTFALKNPQPEVFVSELMENSVNIRMRVWFPSEWANTQDDISLMTALLPRIKTALEAAGIAIPFPQRTLWFANDPKKQ